MKNETAAARFASLGHELRLELFRLMVRAGDEGLPVGELQVLAQRPASTVAYHLGALVDSGLVRQEKEGRVVRCQADFEALDSLLRYMKDECCLGVPLPVFQRDTAA